MPSRPLAGLRVLVTRPEGDGAEAWTKAFADAGATPVLFPTVTVAPPDSWDGLDRALAGLDRYDWLIFTSQTAVASLTSRLPGHCFPAALRARIAAVGPNTARSVEEHGGRVALVPEDNRQEGLAEALDGLAGGTRVLFPLAKGGRTLLGDQLRKQGCLVDVVTAYETVAKTGLAPPPAFDVATFASPSALRVFVTQIGRTSLAGKLIVVIGSTTAEEAEKQGLRAEVAQKPDAAALVAAIARARR
jgi:uroporphyrinogen-III synthase